VEIDEDGGPGGLQAGFALASVAALAGVVAVDEQAEQSLDQRPGAAQAFGRRRVLERFAPGLEEVFAAGEPERPETLRRAARRQRAGAAEGGCRANARSRSRTNLASFSAAF
jgi:hypothetical protein